MYMDTEGVLNAARQNDANTAEALAAAKEAVASLTALRGSAIFGPSPAGRHTEGIFDRSSVVIDELIAEVNRAITILNDNLTLSVDRVLKGEEASGVDFDKLAADNRAHVSNLETTGIKPGEEAYQPPPADQAPGAGQAGAPPADPTAPTVSPSVPVSAPNLVD